MSTPTVRFNVQDRPEFFRELRSRVNNYFKENNLSKQANLKMKIKTVFMVGLYFIPLLLMITGLVTSFWPVMGMWVLMGFGMSGIGLSVMHDANHGAYSKNQTVNRVLGFLANFLGAFHTTWKIQHNVLHHSYTNVEGFDEDIDTPILRFSPKQEHKKIHKFQVLYAPFLYGIMTIHWMLSKDFVQIVRYKKKQLLEKQGVSFRKSLVKAGFNKVWYFALTFFLPWIATGLPWWQILIGFIVMHVITGLLLSLIFQTAHVIKETEFYSIDDTGSVENNWAIHQMQTTANFANKSVLFSWFIGGLNYQIEHHLFPNICHIHYKDISSIVKETAQEFNVPYHHHRTFAQAVFSHFSLLYQLGMGKEIPKLVEAE